MNTLAIIMALGAIRLEIRAVVSAIMWHGTREDNEGDWLFYNKQRTESQTASDEAIDHAEKGAR